MSMFQTIILSVAFGLGCGCFWGVLRVSKMILEDRKMICQLAEKMVGFGTIVLRLVRQAEEIKE